MNIPDICPGCGKAVKSIYSLCREGNIIKRCSRCNAALYVSFPKVGERGYVSPENRTTIHKARDKEMELVKNILDSNDLITLYILLFRMCCLEVQIADICGGVPADPWKMLEENRGCLADPVRRHVRTVGIE